MISLIKIINKSTNYFYPKISQTFLNFSKPILKPSLIFLSKALTSHSQKENIIIKSFMKHGTTSQLPSI
jgi:phosphoribulokinase